MVDPTGGAQARADRLSETLCRLVPEAIAELEATNRASRGALAGAWRHAAMHALDLTAHVLDGVHATSCDLIAHARVVALQARRPFGVKVYGVIFCAKHCPTGRPSGEQLYMCPDCFADLVYVDDADYYPPSDDDTLFRKIHAVVPRGDLL
jgi:hypothetical protein